MARVKDREEPRKLQSTPFLIIPPLVLSVQTDRASFFNTVPTLNHLLLLQITPDSTNSLFNPFKPEKYQFSIPLFLLTMVENDRKYLLFQRSWALIFFLGQVLFEKDCYQYKSSSIQASRDQITDDDDWTWSIGNLFFAIYRKLKMLGSSSQDDGMRF